MSADRMIEFTRDNLEIYLKAAAKEYRKLVNKEIPAELILVGGASVLINYGFRDMTTDIDALIKAASCMKDVINTVGDRYGLPNGWLNADFQNTSSYTPKLFQYSDYYKTYSNIVTIRTVSAEYLVAMKLRSGRQYKNDLSDILGILAEHEKWNDPLTMIRIRNAYNNLYGDWEMLSERSRHFTENAMQSGHFEDLYEETIADEQKNNDLLINFEQTYPGTANISNVNEIISELRKRTGKNSEIN